MIKNLAGEVRYHVFRRLLCEKCGKLHTELPDIVQPYKHYDSEAIQNVLDDSKEAKTCAADNSTIRRWKTEFAKAEPSINQSLAYVYDQLTDEKDQIEAENLMIDRIKVSKKYWLRFVMGLLINSGHKICTQFAFCPPPFSDKVYSAHENNNRKGSKDGKTINDTS